MILKRGRLIAATPFIFVFAKLTRPFMEENKSEHKNYKFIRRGRICVSKETRDSHIPRSLLFIFGINYYPMKGLQIVRKSREDNNPEIVEVELEELDHEK